MSKPNFLPTGYHTLTPYLICRQAAKALDWYKQVFRAEDLMRMPMPDGRLGHAELKIGDSIFMLADEFPERNTRSPQSWGGTAVGLMVYVRDCDAIYHRALQNGANSEQAPLNQFWGDRYAKITDPFGHQWSIGTHIEDVSPEELKRRMAQMPHA